MGKDIVSLFDLDPASLDRHKLPLYDRLIDDFTRSERRSAEGKWLTGQVIQFVYDKAVYLDHDIPSFQDWARRRFRFGVEQAERYMQIARLPRELLKDVDADVHRLAAVQTKDPRFWPPLITAAGEGVCETRLTQANKAGLAFLTTNPDLVAAREYVLAVARGTRFPGKPEKPEETPATLGNKLVRLLGGKARKSVEQLIEMRDSGRPLRGKWKHVLLDEAKQLYTLIADLCEGDTDEAPEAENPLRENPGNAREDEELSQKNSPVDNRPNACPLCRGKASRGTLKHRAGCALSPADRRCVGCGAMTGTEGTLAHATRCRLRLMCDDRHEHTWRCQLDPLCRLYTGSPPDPDFRLPLKPGCPTDRPWLYSAGSESGMAASSFSLAGSAT